MHRIAGLLAGGSTAPVLQSASPVAEDQPDVSSPQPPQLSAARLLAVLSRATGVLKQLLESTQSPEGFGKSVPPLLGAENLFASSHSIGPRVPPP